MKTKQPVLKHPFDPAELFPCLSCLCLHMQFYSAKDTHTMFQEHSKLVSLHINSSVTWIQLVNC